MRISLISPDGTTQPYSSSWELMDVAQDALRHNSIIGYDAVFPAATKTNGLYMIIGVRPSGVIEPTGYSLREES